MAGPITWKTVNDTTDHRGIAALSEAGARNIQGAFDTFGGIVEDRNKRVIKENDNMFKDKVGAMSMDQISAAQEDGSLAELRQSFGGMNSDNLRGYAQDRLTGLRTDANAETTWNTNQAKEAAAPLYQNFMGLTNSKDFGAAREDLEANKDAYIASGQYGQMTSALNQAEVSNQDQMYNNMIRQRGEADYQNQEAFSAMLGSEEFQGMTQSEARDYANSAEAREKYGFDAGEAYQRAGETDNAWLGGNSLTAAQGVDLENYMTTETNRYDNMLSDSQKSHDEVVRVNQAPAGEYNWTGGEGVTMSSLANTATEVKNFDNDEWGGNRITTTIAGGQKEWKKKYLKDLGLTDEQMNSELTDNIVNQITQQALLTLTDDEFLGKQNLSESELADAMKDIAPDWIAQLKRNKLVAESEDRLAQDTASAQEILTTARENSAQYKATKNKSWISDAAKIQQTKKTGTPTPPFRY